VRPTLYALDDALIASNFYNEILFEEYSLTLPMSLKESASNVSAFSALSGVRKGADNSRGMGTDNLSIAWEFCMEAARSGRTAIKVAIRLSGRWSHQYGTTIRVIPLPSHCKRFSSSRTD